MLVRTSNYLRVDFIFSFPAIWNLFWLQRPIQRIGNHPRTCKDPERKYPRGLSIGIYAGDGTLNLSVFKAVTWESSASTLLLPLDHILRTRTLSRCRISKKNREKDPLVSYLGGPIMPATWSTSVDAPPWKRLTTLNSRAPVSFNLENVRPSRYQPLLGFSMPRSAW